MTRILLDTSAYSALLRGDERVRDALRQAEEVRVNPVVLGELLAGFLRGRHRRRNEEELRQFLASPRVHIVPIDEQTAERYALVLAALRRRGRPIPSNDLWIAASAAQHGLRLLTLDAHFLHVEQILVDLLDAPAAS
jgi:predicted nucleic acid-binding protein